MSKKNKIEEQKQEQEVEQPVNPQVEIQETSEPQEIQKDETEILKERIAELEDKNLRMMAEFDNFRRRTNKEKLDLMATAGERIFVEMLPLVDDFERAVAVMDKTNDIDAVREGIKLIQQKFLSLLEKQDVHPICESSGRRINSSTIWSCTMYHLLVHLAI